MLTTRLQHVIPKFVDQPHTGFILGRQILDNVLLASELIKGYCAKSLSPRYMIKIDLKSLMTQLFVNWFLKCISHVSYSILINSLPSEPFKAKKGLRLGDPISPFLFVVGMEYISKWMNTLHNNSDFHYHPRCKRARITHLMFADNLLIFYKVDISPVRAMLA